MRAAKVQASLRIHAVSPEPPLLAHTSSESRGTVRQKARSLAPLNGWACAVKIYHDGMLEDTNSLDGAQLIYLLVVLIWSLEEALEGGVASCSLYFLGSFPGLIPGLCPARILPQSSLTQLHCSCLLSHLFHILPRCHSPSPLRSPDWH